MSESTSGVAALPSVSRRRVTLQNLVFFYLIAGLNIVQGIVLVPLYLAHLPPSLYGAWLATGNVLAWIELADGGITGLLQQRVAAAYGAQRVDALQGIIGTGVSAGAVLSLIPLLAWPLAGLLPGAMGLSGADAEALVESFRLALVGTSLLLGSAVLSSVNSGLQLSVMPGVLTASRRAVLGIVTTVMSLVAGLGLLSLPIGMVARACLLFLGNATITGQWIVRWLGGRIRFSRGEWREMGGLFGYTFVLRLGTVLVERTDAFLVAMLVSPQAAAVLVLTGKAFEVIRLIAVRIPLAVVPSLAHMAADAARERIAEIISLMARTMGWTVGLGAGCVIALNSEFVSLWVGPHMFGGPTLTLFLGAATALSLLVGALAQSLFAMGEVRRVASTSLREAMMKVPLQVVLVLGLGVVGIPLATCLSVTLVSGWSLVRKLREVLDSKDVVRPWWLALRLLLFTSITGAAIAAIVSTRAARIESWTTFAIAAVLTGSLMVLVTGLVDSTFRRFVGRQLERVMARGIS